MGIAADRQRIGGLPSSIEALGIGSGITGAALGCWTGPGCGRAGAANGIGIAWALSVSAAAVAFSGLAMRLNALASALLRRLAFW